MLIFASIEAPWRFDEDFPIEIIIFPLLSHTGEIHNVAS
jgi:hypothetical protein